MYCIKALIPNYETKKVDIGYYKYDGWDVFPSEGPLDLSGVVLFTEREAQRIELPANEEFQWYGAYKR